LLVEGLLAFAPREKVGRRDELRTGRAKRISVIHGGGDDASTSEVALLAFEEAGEERVELREA
jgi:hypothetical protein